VRPSGEILRAIRKEVFEFTQKQFGAKLQLKEETISRMENRIGGYAIHVKHLRWLREMRAPQDKLALYRTLLDELEAALRTENAAPPVRAPAPAPVDTPAVPVEVKAAPVEDANRSDTREASRGDELRQMKEIQQAEESRRAEEALRREEAAKQLSAVVRSTEQLVAAVKDWWAQQTSDIEQVLRQHKDQWMQDARAWWAEEQRRAAEQARSRADEQSHAAGTWVKQAAEAARTSQEHAEQARQANAAALKRMRWTFGAVAAAVVLGPLSTAILQHAETRRPLPQQGAPVHEQDNTGPQSASAENSQQAQQEVPAEEADTTALDGGTALAQAALSALPLPSNGVPGQRAAPCPAGIEEMSGYCWGKHVLTEAEVKAGHCEILRLYEPSPGWCRTHRAGYLPVFAARKDNNAVDPQ